MTRQMQQGSKNIVQYIIILSEMKLNIERGRRGQSFSDVDQGMDNFYSILNNRSYLCVPLDVWDERGSQRNPHLKCKIVYPNSDLGSARK